jgi:hypothetical protein
VKDLSEKWKKNKKLKNIIKSKRNLENDFKAMVNMFKYLNVQQ